MSLTKNPMKPIMANPIAVAMAIFWNSRQQGGKIKLSFFHNVFMLNMLNKYKNIVYSLQMEINSQRYFNISENITLMNRLVNEKKNLEFISQH